MRIITLLALCAILGCSQGHQQEECLREHIRFPMIKEMLNISKHIHKSLPKDNRASKRILGKHKKCYKNIADFKHLLDIYEDHVFQKLWKNNAHLRPKIFMDSFRTLKDVMDRCVNRGPQIQSRCARENLKKMEDNFSKLKPDDLYKAVSEFQNVLVWISLAMDRGRSHKKIQ
ncbi:interleukin-26 [Triplophysa dalaica]|uniref:interleukin-26 n=1 Tax=Triplophysa dalaica TaxID=1582913 RepID=UPI0024E01151|nr:interleukin-26 [Triplophysa dalaica]